MTAKEGRAALRLAAETVGARRSRPSYSDAEYSAADVSAVLDVNVLGTVCVTH
ncbi:hypothetical protein ACFZCU_47310 [Streptomyces canus]|uniref:hypothetical protein n=1 Tax=Streptomyces canus TaxID=58343 RepID=UPI0036E3EE67